MSIPFTQYLRPNGQKREISIETDAGTEQMAVELIKAGRIFEIEELMNGLISMSCELVDGTGDVDDVHAIEMCKNGPPVVDAVKKLVADAYKIYQK